MQYEKIDWTLAPTVVTGHYELRELLQHKMKMLAKRYNQTIIRWICHVKGAGYNNYQKPEYDPEWKYPELVQYFVRGAECVLTRNINGISKGTKGIYIGLAWEKGHQNINTFAKQEIIEVEQPNYIIMKTIPKKRVKRQKLCLSHL